jgi:biopolymer transport protein TolR
MGMAVGSSKGVASTPNVVPMIDVMLVLLIIFMLVIPQVSAGFTAVPPTGVNLKPHPEEEQDQILGIDASGNYYLNRVQIPKDSLGPLLRAIFEGRVTDRLLYVKAHKDIEYSLVLDALDVAAKNEVRVAGMITEQQPGTVSAVASDRIIPGMTAPPPQTPPGGQP